MRIQRNFPVDKRFWHVCFAWLPVPLFGIGQWAWLETVKRKGTYHSSSKGGGQWHYIYRGMEQTSP